MQFDELWHSLRQEAADIGWLQWISTVFGVAEVLLARVNNILLYPAGIISSLIAIFLLFDTKLYADAGLNVYYVVMSIYGWWFWSRKNDEPAPGIGWTTRSEWLVVIGIAAGGFAVLYILLARFTPSTTPVWDAWVTATAYAGTWLLARRKIENWILLNVSNLFAVPLLYYKQLHLFAALTVFLFIVACFGYFDWRRRYKLQIA
ncbi:MAG TPA: nicotinamide riboside transporter PnuC [Puia sp.]|jgi:nicotinamide mononucleotide transporter|nr:nicotinamide riboside transporter PnuC [Puia sp.]